MKILQLIKGLDIGGDSGGAELVGIKIAREMAKIPEVCVEICAYYSVGTQAEKQWLEVLNREGIKTYFISTWRGTNNIPAFLKGLLTLASKLRNSPSDVIHSHFQLGSLAAIILKTFGLTKKAFRTAHIREEWNHGKWTSILKPVFIDRAFPHFLDGEIAVSNAIKLYLEGRRPGKIDCGKIHLFYNAIDTSFIEECALQITEISNTIEKNSFLIVSVGRLAKQKGYPYLLQAIKLVREQIPNIKLFILGDGEDKEFLLEQKDRLGLDEQVKFLGLVPPNEVPPIIKKSDIFVLASLWEGLPTVILEAMAIKVPVIATAIPGTDELVQDGKTGWLVPPEDPVSLASAIIKAYQYPEEQELIVTNAYDNLKRFRIDMVAKQYYELYRRSLNKFYNNYNS